MNDAKAHSRFYAVVPAAGVGRRVGGETPKQYLTLHGKTLVEHTLQRLLAAPWLEQIVVAVNPNDTYWQQLAVFKNPRITVVVGGDERADSVLAGLSALTAEPEDWVLVHDVARPCLSMVSLDKLVSRLREHPVGGLLALPASDTIKQAQNGESLTTIDRSQLWLAQTPQMFRYQLLTTALSRALQRGEVITDEASAIELAGFKPILVEGLTSNIKVTRPEDIALAGFYLRQPVVPPTMASNQSNEGE